MNKSLLKPKRSLLKPIISLVVLAAVIGGFYLYEHLSVKNANKLIDDVNMLNQKKAILSSKFVFELTAAQAKVLQDNISESQFNEFIAEIDNLKNKYISDLESIKDKLETSKAIKYLENYIERQKLEIEIVLYPLRKMDIKTGIINENEQQIEEGTKEFKDKLKPLNDAKEEMEKDFSKIMRQHVTLD